MIQGHQKECIGMAIVHILKSAKASSRTFNKYNVVCLYVPDVERKIKMVHVWIYFPIESCEVYLESNLPLFDRHFQEA